MSVDFLQYLVGTYTDKGKQLAITTVYATNRSTYTNICSCKGSDGCRNYLIHRAILEEDDDENDD